MNFSYQKKVLSFRDYIIIILAIIASSALSYLFQSHQIITGDQLQMLQKGFMGAIDGNYLPYGNAASTVGNVPGSLSSYIVGLPLEIFKDVMAPIYLLITLRALSIVIFCNALTFLFSRRVVVIGTIIFALSPWFLYEELLYNPSYLLFGSTIFFNALVRMRTHGQKVTYKKAFILSVILSLATGYCLQLHYSWPVLLVLCGVLFLRKDIRISFLGIFVGMAIVGITLIPYFNELVNNALITGVQSHANNDRYFGYGLVHVYPVLKTLAYFLRFGSLFITKKAMLADIVNASTVLEVMRYIYLVLAQALGVFTVIVSAYASYRLIFSPHYRQDHGIYTARSISLSTIIAVLVAGAASTITVSYWHLIIIFVFAQLPILVLLERSKRIKNRHIFYLVICMLVMNVVSLLHSDQFSFKASYVNQANYLCLQQYGSNKCNLSDSYANMLESMPINEIFFDYKIMPAVGATEAEDSTKTATDIKDNNNPVNNAVIQIEEQK